MRKRVLIGLGALVLALLVAMIVWQGSFSLGDYAPASPEQTVLFWAISTLIALLTVIVGFMLFRTGVKLYIERQSNREGSRIRSKLVVGALALSFLPVIFLVMFGYGVMNRNLVKWFSRPGEGVNLELVKAGNAMRSEFEARVNAQARWLASLPHTYPAAEGGDVNLPFFRQRCQQQAIDGLWITQADGQRVDLCQFSGHASTPSFTAKVPVEGVAGVTLSATAHMSFDVAAEQQTINKYVSDYNSLAAY